MPNFIIANNICLPTIINKIVAIVTYYDTVNHNFID